MDPLLYSSIRLESRLRHAHYTWCRGPQKTYSTNSTAAKLAAAAGARAGQVNTYEGNRNVVGKTQESFDIFAAVDHNGLRDNKYVRI